MEIGIWTEKKVLDKGFVKLINFSGGDLSVVAAARVSNGLGPEEASKGTEKDQGLINYLIKHKHGTPFEHNLFTFYVKAPIFVTREWMRHRIGSYNELSGRYTEFAAEFYVPNRFRIPAASNKQGSEFLGEDSGANDWLIKHIEKMSLRSFQDYQYLITNGLARELARIVLPLNMYTHFYWSVNARSLMNFLNLRCSEDAQWEIRQYALATRDIFKETMPQTYEAWEKNGYIAP